MTYKICLLLSLFFCASCSEIRSFYQRSSKTESSDIYTVGRSEVVIAAVEDRFSFQPQKLKAFPGQKIKLKIKNKLKSLPIRFSVLKKGEDPVVSAFLALQESGPDKGWQLPSSYIIADSKLLASGEAQSLSLSLNEEGVYYFISTYPGQVDDLQGQIFIQKKRD